MGLVIFLGLVYCCVALMIWLTAPGRKKGGKGK